jgi:hypothetical protein
MTNAPQSDDPTAAPQYFVIAPCTYFMDLEDETGGTTSTPEFVERWNERNAPLSATLVEISPPSPPQKLAAATAAGSTFTVDGKAVSDLSDYQGTHLDYCAGCVAELSCSSMDALTTPLAETRNGNTIIAYYQCRRGHRWTCSWAASESA